MKEEKKADITPLLEPQVLVCDDCGTTKDVMDTFCPYAQDVNNTDVPALLCPECYRQRCLDI